MAYSVKYYKEIVSQGKQWRIEIAQETTTPFAPVEIGPVLQGLRLVVQGDQADIDTPIVKTSLEMTFVDAPDLEDERKCGYWEEFYTSSAFEYKVRLWKDNQVEWTGYVTPDSFNEDLRYRGSVTIIARDNLGMLQDFTFDAIGNKVGLISLRDLITTGLSRVRFAMGKYIQDVGQARIPYAEESTDPSIYDVLFNVDSFKDKNWQEVLDDVLYSTGLTLRYTGQNRFVLAPIRGLGLGANLYWSDVEKKDVRFVAYGHRELSPAVKFIKESISFDLQDNIANSVMPENAYGAATSYIASNGDILPLHTIVGGDYQAAGESDTLAMNVFEYPINEKHRYGEGEIYDPGCVYIACNVPSSEYYARSAVYKIALNPGTYSFEFTIDKALALYDNLTTIGYNDFNAQLRFVRINAWFAGNDGTYKTLLNHYDPTSASDAGTSLQDLHWIDGRVSDTASNNANVKYDSQDLPTNYKAPSVKVESVGMLFIQILSPLMTDRAVNSISKGLYAGITGLKVLADNASNPIMNKSVVTTKYNDNNNIILTRSPQYGINTATLVSHKLVSNAIFSTINSRYGYKGLKNWKFNDSDTPQLLSVLIHQQILAFYSKPNNVLTGELVTDDPTFDALYKWGGKEHLLMSGKLNILTGRMENAVLREFLRYEQLWDDSTWVEKDYYDVSSDATTINVYAHSSKEITIADIEGVPSWMTASIFKTVGGYYGIALKISENTGDVREATIYVDGAGVRIVQQAKGAIIGDFNEDFNEDFS